MATRENNEPTGWVGWIAFASFMMIIGGFFEAIVGLTAIFKETFYVAVNNYLFTFNVHAWGWVHLIWSIIVILAGFALLTGHLWARVVGVIAAGISMLVNMAFIPYYPVWSLLVIVVDIIVIYSIIAHGSELEE